MRKFGLLIFATVILGGSLFAQARDPQTPSSGAPVNAAKKTPEGKHGKHHHHHKHHHKKA